MTKSDDALEENKAALAVAKDHSCNMDKQLDSYKTTIEKIRQEKQQVCHILKE